VACTWRLEKGDEIITGSFDWHEPEDERIWSETWDPAYGGSLQESRLRSHFQDFDDRQRVIKNRTPYFTVLSACADEFGGFQLNLTGDYVLRAFPAGSRGEFWRLFDSDDPLSHFVLES